MPQYSPCCCLHPLMKDAACRRELPCSQALWFLFCFAACKSSGNTRDIFHSISHGKPGLTFSQLLASYLLGIKMEWSEWEKQKGQNKAKQISLWLQSVNASQQCRRRIMRMEDKCSQMMLLETAAAEEQQGPGPWVPLLGPSSPLAAKPS